jgi:hypothetical protein
MLGSYFRDILVVTVPSSPSLILSYLLILSLLYLLHIPPCSSLPRLVSVAYNQRALWCREELWEGRSLSARLGPSSVKTSLGEREPAGALHGQWVRVPACWLFS